ncbi:uncharacterized protein BT62DRAFT_747336 [Guyanagaster necrorhizus]|uniref:Signal recognition particle receptor subunit beta n=1 Tax=Guyanagaster necrorhizus TaxID=856835 RepID=A0A9P7VWZ6_9AGAR|nr:uncharacterized protein BT62DRAFT_747336 [Guyanagaster necrorhizus MCA 3950]KAG7447990.1 hypothetical protein BT62DRAFT_747336 [Guyanagaster necrorhizus MCA 3950]
MNSLAVLEKILIAIFVFFVVVVIVSIVKRRGNVVLLVGPSDGGKTAIFSKLVYDQLLPSHTSLQANASSVKSPSFNYPVVIVDIPGHPKMRDQFKEHMKGTIVIAFVVDASTVSRNAAAVAEHLHIIMDAINNLPSHQKTPSLIVVAHKTDLLKNVARELEKRRASQSGGLEVEGLGEDEKTELGGLECAGTATTFRFSDWKGAEVHFIATSVKESTKGADDEKSDPQIGLSSLRELLFTIQR